MFNGVGFADVQKLGTKYIFNCVQGTRQAYKKVKFHAHRNKLTGFYFESYHNFFRKFY